jgi:hypothetical protein
MAYDSTDLDDDFMIMIVLATQLCTIVHLALRFWFVVLFLFGMVLAVLFVMTL